MSAGRVAELSAKVEELLAEVARLRAEHRAEVARLRAELDRAHAENAALREENAALRARLRGRGKADPPGEEKPRPRPPRHKPPTGRNRGGQPGHEPSHRALLPPEQVDEVVALKPETCQDCGQALSGQDPSPLRHQVTEVPQPKPLVIEYQQHELRCGCGSITRAALPDGIPTGSFGPRLLALVGLCTGRYRMSKRQAQELLRDFFSVSMGLGSVSQCERIVSDALAWPVEEAHDYVQEQASANLDETTWYEGHVRSYLWTMATSWVTVFMIATHRSARVARSLLGTFSGILISDRLKSYDFWPLRRRQFCWAHLERRFEEFLLCGPEARRIGKALLGEVHQLWSWWHRVRDGPLKRSTFQTYMRPLRRRVLDLLRQGASCSHAEVAGTCRELLESEAALWTFVRVEGIEPTNNDAERALRHGVIWRRTSFGTDSQAGSRFVERILTAVTSLRQQNRNVLDFVTNAVQASMTGSPLPSLLPGSECVDEAA
jgi:transposase